MIKKSPSFHQHSYYL